MTHQFTKLSSEMPSTALQIVPGSLQAAADAQGGALALAFMSAEIAVLVDTSGSMAARDSRDSQQRYAVACSELSKLQRDHPGSIAVYSFSDSCIFCPGGVPEFLMSGTDLLAALRKLKNEIDGLVKQIIVISDGEPDNGQEDACIALAHTFASEINAVFVGPKEDADARAFMKKLASAGKGKAVTTDRVADLAGAVKFLLTDGKGVAK